LKLPWFGERTDVKTERATASVLSPLRSRRHRSTAAIAALALTLGTLGGAALATGTPAPAAAAAQGCGYADNSANNGNYAGTICWFDFSAFDEAAARTSAGQPMQVVLDGGYIAKFNLALTDVPSTLPMTLQARSTPLETRFAFGTDAYRGVPGLDTLYSDPAPFGIKGGQVTFNNIQVVDGAGNPVTGYSFVAADTEDNVAGESFVWTSDKPLNEIERLAPNGGWGCKSPVGVGTTKISCDGTGAGGSSTAGGKSTALLIAADTPSSFATQWITQSQSGIAIGIQTAKLTVNKQVSGRVDPSDSFDLSVRSPEGTLAGAATTGTNATATTGGLTVLPRMSGAAYTMGETATTGSPALLSNYASAWSCVNATTGSSTALPSGAGTTKTIAPAVGDDITCTVTNTARASTLGMVKHAGTPIDANGDGITDAGDSIQYTFTVTNTGDLPMSNISVTDAKVGAVTCPVATLAPGASEECSANSSYTITPADVTGGSVDNSATAQGTPPGSTVPRSSTPSTTTTPTTAPAPALSLVKSADPSDAASYTVGQQIAYHFAVTNTGNVPVNNIAIDEGAFTGTGTMSSVVCPQTTLAAGAQEVCEATYTLTQADVDNGSITNAATATGTPTGSITPIGSPPSTVSVPTPPQPGLTIAKTANPGTITAAGQTVTYSFLLTNTGNVTLQNVTVADSGFSGTGTLGPIACPTTTLVAGQVETCTAAYTVTQADVDAGILTNSATGTGTPPTGTPLPPVPSNPVDVNIPRTPALSIVKTANVQAAAVGQTITYSFVATNTGNVTITNPQITEGAFSGTGSLSAVTCPSGTITLIPGDAVTCTADYTLTQADIDSGALTNTATATGTTPPGTTLPPVPPSTSTVTTDPHAALSLVKTADTTKATTVGQIVRYTFTVTNTGNITVTDPAVVEGTFSGHGDLSKVTCPSGKTLQPGDTLSCSATYTVVAADLTGGTLSNTATATGTVPGGDPLTSDPSTATVQELAVAVVSGLAKTGSNIAGPAVAIALLLILGGAGFLIIRRRKNGHGQETT
jgi:uncharacterized repeat protein (TIGR01451 family)/LPXTG-motif cell wall-anchored protein